MARHGCDSCQGAETFRWSRTLGRCVECRVLDAWVKYRSDCAWWRPEGDAVDAAGEAGRVDRLSNSR